MTQKYKPPAQVTNAPSSKDKVEVLLLSSIKNKFDVRVALDQDRVLQFVGMYQSNHPVPPIEVVRVSDPHDEPEYAFIDGRTRAAARAYLDLPDIEAVIRPGSLRDDPAALYTRALEANWGGAKPPTRADIVHTILRMLEAGVSRTAVKDNLTFLPPGAVRGYTADALSILSKRRIGKALDDITDGLSVEGAARKNNLKLETLKEIVAGKKGKWGKSRTNEVESVTEMNAYVSRTYFSANTGISKKFQNFLARVEDGEISVKGAAKSLAFWKNHVNRTILRITDWESRLESIAKSQGTVLEPEPTKPPKKEQNNTYAGAKAETLRSELNGHTKTKPVKRNEELPKAIRATGAHQARPLKQVDGALQRLRKRGMEL